MTQAIEIIKKMVEDVERAASMYPVYTEQYLFYEAQALALRGALLRLKMTLPASRYENNSK